MCGDGCRQRSLNLSVFNTDHEAERTLWCTSIRCACGSISSHYGFHCLLGNANRHKMAVKARGGGSSIVKVPEDVPPARVCFFKPSSLAKGILFAIFRPFSLGKGIIFGNFSQRNVKLRQFLSCKETQIFLKFWSLECKNLASFA